MTGWIEHKARRMVFAGALAAVLGVPTLACMGGSEEEAPAEEPGGDDGAKEDPKEEEDFDPAKAAVGTWQFKPSPEELRTLKIIDKAIKGMPKQKAKQAFQPPLTDAELRLFDDVQKNKDAPEVKAIADLIKNMKTSNTIMTETTLTLKSNSGEILYQKDYTISNKTEDAVTLKLGDNEEHVWTFKGNDEVNGEVKKPVPYNFTLRRR